MSLAALILASGCTGNGPSQAPGPIPAVNPGVDHAQYLLVSDECANEGLVFGLGTAQTITTPTAPTDNYTGASTTLSEPYNAFVDNAGFEWFSNFGNASVEYTSIGKSTNSAPTKKLTGANTTFVGPTGIYVDSGTNGVDRYVYVADYDAAKIDIFQYSLMTGSSNNIAPTWTISGANTTLSEPEALTVDSSGNIWVANAGGQDVLEFSNPTGGAGGNSNVAPSETIGGGSTTLVDPLGIYIDSGKNIWVGDDGGHNAVVEFTASSGAGDVTSAPYRTISGASTDISTPYGVAVDSGGNVYEVGTGSAEVNIWLASSLSPGSNTSAPTYYIAGASSKLDCPAGIQVYSTGTTDY